MVKVLILLDPLRVCIVTGVVFFWLYCIQHTDRNMRAHAFARPWINLAVVIGGPPAWIIVLFSRKILESEKTLPPALARLAHWLGLRGDPAPETSAESLVELLRSDGRPLSVRFAGGLIEQAEAMTVARRIVHRGLLLRAADILLDPKAQDVYQMRFRVDGLLNKPEPTRRWL